MSTQSKEIEKIKKENKLQETIINKMKDHQVLKKYIKNDEVICNIVEALQYNRFKVHRDTFKKFMATKYHYDIDNIEQHELEALAINPQKFNTATTKIIDKKLEELKYLKLVEFNNENNYVLGTDLLSTILSGEYKRTSKSIKSENQFIMETEDKLFAFRHLIANKQYLDENKAFLEELDIYNNIYVTDINQIVIGRREKETERGLYNRLKKILKSSLIDTSIHEDIGKQMPIKIYFNKKMRINIKDFESIFKTIPNEIEIIRY